MDLLEKIAMQLLLQANSGLVTLMVLVIGYLGWTLHQSKKEFREELKQYHDLVDKMQQSIQLKNGEERDMLLSVIDKYHQSQICIKEAIGEIKTILTAVSMMQR